jgi:hypothetical protein
MIALYLELENESPCGLSVDFRAICSAVINSDIEKTRSQSVSRSGVSRKNGIQRIPFHLESGFNSFGPDKFFRASKGRNARAVLVQLASYKKFTSGDIRGSAICSEARQQHHLVTIVSFVVTCLNCSSKVQSCWLEEVLPLPEFGVEGWGVDGLPPSVLPSCLKPLKGVEFCWM